MAGDIIDLEVVDGVAEALPAFPASLKLRRQLARRDEITVVQLERFFENLQKTGVKYRSAEEAGISIQTINRLAKDDADFQGYINEAMDLYRDLIVSEAHRRAIEGWDEGVFSQKTGEQIGTIRKYDSKLLELLLKRHIPEFREKFEGTLTVTGGVLVAPVAQLSAEAWVEQHQDAKLQLLGDGTAEKPAE